MSRGSEAVSVAAVDPNDQGSALETLLTEYHTWLAQEACEWAADRDAAGAGTDATEPLPNDGEYDPPAAAAEDGATITDPEADAWAFLARNDGDAAGVVFLYGVSKDMAEIKRLYVRPEHRGEGVGRALCQAAIDAASEGRYRQVGLTTPPWSKGAHALYEELAFEYTDPYPETALPEKLHDDALFMQRALGS